jgi:hypothetical protein
MTTAAPLSSVSVETLPDPAGAPPHAAASKSGNTKTERRIVQGVEVPVPGGLSGAPRWITNREFEPYKDPALFAAKIREEEALRAWVAADDGRVAEFADAWDAIADAQRAHRELYDMHSLVELARGFNTRLFTIARHLVRAADERAKPNDERLREYRETAIQSLSRTVLSPAPVYAEYEQVKFAWSLTKLREVLAPYVEVARKAQVKKASRRQQRSQPSRERSALIRRWAKENGKQVNERGRIPQSIVEEYEAAQR